MPSRLINRESSKEYILIIEDYGDGVNLLLSLLRDLSNLNFTYHHVAHQNELETALAKQEWDLILCNFDMPEINAVGLLRSLQSKHYSSPVIFLSELASMQVAVDMMRLGARGFVEKEDSQRLLDIIRQELQTRRMRSKPHAIENILHASDLSYKSIVEHQTELICRYDKHFRLTFVNQAYSQWRGEAPHTLLGKSILQHIPVAEQTAAIANVRNLTSEQPSTISVHQSVLPDGSYRLLEWTDHAIFDKQGQLIAYQGIGRDITEIQAAKLALEEANNHLEQRVMERTAELEESEERFRMFIESAPIATVITRPLGQIEFVNDAALNLFAYQREELLGQDIELLVPVYLRDKHREYRFVYQNHLVHLRKGAMELQAQRKDGTVFPVDIQLSYVAIKPEPMVMSFILDISQRKAAEKALMQSLAQEKELGELKSRFVSMASHEFRTPLAAILATTDTLSIYRQKMTQEQIDARLEKIRQQVMHMKDIMEDVLQLARIQAGRVEFFPLEEDLNALCLEIIEEFQSDAENLNRISYQAPASLRMVYDRRLMRQIITNLVSNALKYSTQAKPISIELSQTATYILLEVHDEGIGIPESDLKHIFEPFHRATNIGTISGTGLGLSIAKQAIELHQGEIAIESRVNVGTRFSVIFPMIKTKMLN